MSPDLKQLITKLNDGSRRALEGAAGLCLSRTNYNVEIEHWFIKILETPGNDLELVLKAFDVEPSQFAAELTRGVDQFKTGNSRSPALSPNLVDLIRDAWLFASVDFGDHQVRSAHLLFGLLAQDSLRRTLSNSVVCLDQVSVETLKSKLYAIVERSSETTSPSSSGPGSATEPGGKTASPARSKSVSTASLDQYTIDLTAKAREGKIDPVLGRDSEVRQVVDVLCRRRQNNPILTGEPGVGKTAVAEGFALKIAAGDVPDVLKDVSLRTLDLGLLQAGAGVKGEFENRLKSVINEVNASPQPIILFIDEAHQMIGAGGQAGQGDAANLLKPALARGELRTIAATTWAEYKKYFERDAALARRFQVVKVEEPSESAALEMMRGVVGTLEAHHVVEILSDAVEDAVRLSKRYIAGRYLPDKSVSLLDTTCARINLSQNSTPPAVEDNQRRIDQIEVLVKVLDREVKAGIDHSERLGELQQELEELLAAREKLLERWEQERELVILIKELRSGEGSIAETEPAGSLTEELRSAESQLRTLQGKQPLVHPYVDSQAVAETIEAWTGIPVGRMVADEVQTILKLKDLMEESVVGQEHAMRVIAQSIQTSRAKLTDPRTPIGVFLLVGTSGVGKTETAVTLADLLYGGEQNMTVINMSEFKEEHKVSLLMGSPPGYVGYGEGGILTEAVRRKPYSVVLLDEMEKAHPGVQDIFYQVFDKGQMKDGEGRDIDFRNTIILMTSNAGTDFIKSLCADEDTTPGPEAFTEAIYPELLKTFKPAFLGRCTIVPYYPLRDEIMRRIVGLKLGKIQRTIREQHKAAFSWSDGLVDAVVARCTEVDTGARNIDLILRRSLLPELSSRFLARMGESQPIGNVRVSYSENEFAYEIE